MTYIPPTTAPSATPADWSTSTAAAPKSATELDKDTFMKLLVAQLKYQDPLSPADPQQFLAQTAQFTSVEKLEQIARASADQTWAIALTTASTLVGQHVSFLREDGTTGSGIVASALTEPDGMILNIGTEQVPLGAVTRIASAPTDPAPTDPGPTDPAPTDPD